MLLQASYLDSLVTLFTRPSRRLTLLAEQYAQDAAKVAAQIAELRAAAAAIPDPTGQDDSMLVEAHIDAGTLAEADLILEIGRAGNPLAEWERARHALQNVHDRLRTRQGEKLRGAVPRMLAGLDREVRTVVDQLRASPMTEAEATTFEQGIARDVPVDVIKAWQAARADYHDIYKTAAQLVAATDFEGGQYTGESFALSRISNVEKVWPRFGFHLAKLDVRTPWQPNRGGDPKNTDAFLNWLIATPAARPTVLTLDQLTERRQSMRDVITDAREQHTKEHARNNDRRPVPTATSR